MSFGTLISYTLWALPDSHGFLSNWEGELPPAKDRKELRLQLATLISEQHPSEMQVEQLIDFFEQYEKKYYETPAGRCYHRACGGGSVMQRRGRSYCANCGPLPNDLRNPPYLQ